MADIVEAHAEQVKRNGAAQPSSRQAFVADEVVPDHAQERVPRIVLIVVRTL